MTLRVSVVVPTYRRPELLETCLRALAEQDLDPAQYEIVVSDDASSEATRRQVQSWSKRAAATVRYVAPATHGPAAARNAGWRAGQGGVIAFTDDDCIPDRGWLTAGLGAIDAGADAAWGRLKMPLPACPTDYERNEGHLEHAGFITANCFVRRAAMEAVGGFDERFTMAWREDSDLHFTLIERGYRIESVPTAVVVHPIRPGRWGVSVSQQRKSQFNALLYKKHPALYRTYIQKTPPLLYYAIALAILCALVGVAACWPAVAVVGAAAWLLLTAWFCFYRLRDTSWAPSHVAEMLLTSAVIPPLSIFWRLRGAFRFRCFFV